MLTASLIPVVMPSPPVVALVYLNATLAFQVVSFLVLLAALNKWLFKPMLSYLDERAEGIKKTLDEASVAVENAQTDREAAARELDDARRESYEIRAQARTIAQGERERIIDGARVESEQIVSQTQREIAQSVEQAREALRERVGTLAIDVAEKVLRGELTEEQRRKATTVYLNEAAQI